MTNKELKAMQVVNEIIKRTSFWNIDMWYDFRNVFIDNYYELNKFPRDEFNEWKLKRIIKYNSFIEQKR